MSGKAPSDQTVTEAAALTPWRCVAEAAARARCSRAVIYRECRLGRLRHARVGGKRQILLLDAWIDRWIEETSVPIVQPRHISSRTRGDDARGDVQQRSA